MSARYLEFPRALKMPALMKTAQSRDRSYYVGLDLPALQPRPIRVPRLQIEIHSIASSPIIKALIHLQLLPHTLVYQSGRQSDLYQ
jgi:hypothetical protein